VFGYNTSTSGINYGVYGLVDSTSGRGVYGASNALTGINYGVYGVSDSTSGRGTLGYATATTGSAFGIYGLSESSTGRGVYGIALATTGLNYGVYGDTNSPSGYAGYFDGIVHVTGTLTKGGGGFKIDHPLDPANQYLFHSFVESPEMKNVYDGVVTLDANGAALVQMPVWFEALNMDFRYQLTTIGSFAPVYIAQGVQGNSFQIAGGAPSMQVSWQVTGVRHDPWAEANRQEVEQPKLPEEQNKYLHPELYGMPKEQAVHYMPINEQLALVAPLVPAPLLPLPVPPAGEPPVQPN